MWLVCVLSSLFLVGRTGPVQCIHAYLAIQDTVRRPNTAIQSPPPGRFISRPTKGGAPFHASHILLPANELGPSAFHSPLYYQHLTHRSKVHLSLVATALVSTFFDLLLSILLHFFLLSLDSLLTFFHYLFFYLLFWFSSDLLNTSTSLPTRLLYHSSVKRHPLTQLPYCFFFHREQLNIYLPTTAVCTCSLALLSAFFFALPLV
jgi:hypothetical protein